MKMERVAEVVRGWPYDGSLDRYEPIKASVTLINGDWVQKQSDNTVDKAGATATAFTRRTADDSAVGVLGTDGAAGICATGIISPRDTD